MDEYPGQLRDDFGEFFVHHKLREMRECYKLKPVQASYEHVGRIVELKLLHTEAPVSSIGLELEFRSPKSFVIRSNAAISPAAKTASPARLFKNEISEEKLQELLADSSVKWHLGKLKELTFIALDNRRAYGSGKVCFEDFSAGLLDRLTSNLHNLCFYARKICMRIPFKEISDSTECPFCRDPVAEEILIFARNAKQSIMRVAGRKTKAVLFSAVHRVRAFWSKLEAEAVEKLEESPS